MIAHWDEAESDRAEAGHTAGEWTDLGVAAGTKTVGLSRIKFDPGKWSTPLHRQTAAEEIFFVLDGSGICLLCDHAEGDHGGGSRRLLARTAGAELTGLNWGRLPGAPRRVGSRPASGRARAA